MIWCCKVNKDLVEMVKDFRNLVLSITGGGGVSDLLTAAVFSRHHVEFGAEDHLL